MTEKHVRTALDEHGEKGEFKRVDAAWRSWIKKGDPEFPPEKDRYHLYISLACPWANGCFCVLKMKGLEDTIGVSIVHPTWQKTNAGVDDHSGWAFKDPSDPPTANQNGHGSFECDGCIPDTINNAKYIRDLYRLADDKDGKYTVPVLWDKKKKTIVSNESTEILRMLNSEFNEFAKNPDLDLYPADLEIQINAAHSWIYPNINNGVYRCGFAKTQEAYDAAADSLYENLCKAEELLGKHRFVTGSRLTGIDLRLYMTLIRFDPVYVVYFKTSRKRISEFPNLFNFMKDIYQIPEVKAVTNLRHIKMHYFTSHPNLNFYAIIPKGSDEDVDLDAPHDRARLGKKRPLED